MLNISYYSEDNILNSSIISNENDYYYQTEIIDNTNTDTYSLNYNNNYPSLVDSTIYDTTSTVINSDNIEILQDSTSIISLPIHNSFMITSCNELCNDGYKYKLNNFNLIISGYIDTI